jgi:hypothetical protein
VVEDIKEQLHRPDWDAVLSQPLCMLNESSRSRKGQKYWRCAATHRNLKPLSSQKHTLPN